MTDAPVPLANLPDGNRRLPPGTRTQHNGDRNYAVYLNVGQDSVCIGSVFPYYAMSRIRRGRASTVARWSAIDATGYESPHYAARYDAAEWLVRRFREGR